MSTKLHPTLSQRFTMNFVREIKARGLTHAGMAGLARISTPYVSMLASGVRTPTLDMVQQIADGLKIDASALFKGV